MGTGPEVNIRMVAVLLVTMDTVALTVAIYDGTVRMNNLKLPYHHGVRALDINTKTDRQCRRYILLYFISNKNVG